MDDKLQELHEKRKRKLEGTKPVYLTDKQANDKRMEEKYKEEILIKKNIGFNINLPKGYLSMMNKFASEYERKHLSSSNMYKNSIMFNPTINTISEYLFIKHYPNSMKQITKSMLDEFRLLLEDNKYEYLHSSKIEKESNWLIENIYNKMKTIQPTSKNIEILKLKISGKGLEIDDGYEYEYEYESESEYESEESECEECGGAGCKECKK